MTTKTTKVWYDHNTTTENGITMLHETFPHVTHRTELWLAEGWFNDIMNEKGGS